MDTRTLIAMAGLLAGSQVALGQEADAEATLPLGYLSDPETPAKNVNDALKGGKVHLDNRFRFEVADTTMLDTSYAWTNRFRLGYETKELWGFTSYIEMENVTALSRGEYYVPETMQGPVDHTPILDPEGTELNRAWLRYASDDLFDSGIPLELKLGRQRIQLDDERFVGTDSWRQFEQTFDAISLRTDLGSDKLDVFYAYVFGVQRIFGPDGTNWDSQSHLINISYEHSDELKITPFAYMLDFDQDAPMSTSDTFGLRLSGTFLKGSDTEDGDALPINYEATYAHQSATEANPVDSETDFFAAEIEFAPVGGPSFAVGYQYLGSDASTASFQFPLGSTHEFQGFADEFVTTPLSGLHDIYATLSADLPQDITASASYHFFLEVDGAEEFGYEIDFEASKKIDENWSVLVKGATLDGQSGVVDTDRFWVQFTFAF